MYYYANGDIYSGAFKAGKKHGSGQIFFKVRALARQEAASAVFARALRRVRSVTVEAMRLAAAACYLLRRTSTKRSTNATEPVCCWRLCLCGFVFQAQSCMFIGVWADGEFVDGKWVHQDGTTFQGSFEVSVPVSRRLWENLGTRCLP